MTRSRLPIIFAAVSMMGSGLLLAQTSAQSQSTAPPSSSYPSSSSQSPAPPPSSQGAYSSATPADQSSMSSSSQLKTCISEARAQNPSLSEHAAKEACKAQMSSSSPQK